MITFRDYALSSAATLRQPAASQNFVDVARLMAQQNAENVEETVIHPSFQAAYAVLQLNRPRKGMPGEGDKRAIGAKRTPNRRRIAYAMGAVKRRAKTPEGYRIVDGPQRLFVLHATKGWRLVPGIES